jgi:putative redox protein
MLTVAVESASGGIGAAKIVSLTKGNNMVEIDISYSGQLRCSARHGPSNATLTTDAPKDNQGQGAAFSPTDLVATALGSCMLTIMGIYAQRNNIDLQGATAQVIKDMAAAPARRIGKLTVKVKLPKTVLAEHRAALEKAARACPVHHSLSPDIQQDVTFVYE